MAREKLSDKQKDILRVLSKTGIIPKDNLKELGIRPSNIDKMISYGLIKSVDVLQNKNEISTCYKLDTNGQKRCQRYFDSTYSGGSNRHNIELNNQYKMLSENEQRTWLTENQIREIVRERIYEVEDYTERERYLEMYSNGDFSMPDGMYVSDSGVCTCIEVITNTYGKIELEHKQNTIDFLGCSCNYVKI